MKLVPYEIANLKNANCYLKTKNKVKSGETRTLIFCSRGKHRHLWNKTIFKGEMYYE